uniref:Uncharacterized protein n=1 Tax=Cacopsylla melanoneura TaxID=428564 RepID=A0A8D8TTQ5_9HEMI
MLPVWSTTQEKPIATTNVISDTCILFYILITPGPLCEKMAGANKESFCWFMLFFIFLFLILLHLSNGSSYKGVYRKPLIRILIMRHLTPHTSSLVERLSD